MRSTLAILAVLAASAVLPQHATAKDAKNQAFANLDKNSDNVLSKDEAAADKELAKRFDKFDANKDGKLSEEEFIKANQDNDKRVLADSAITTKVKGELLITKGIPSTSISVSTYEGRVQLAGFVDTKEQVAAAGKVAAAVSGVQKVQNDLKVK